MNIKKPKGISRLGNVLKQKCFGCDKIIDLDYFSQEEWAGRCEDCGLHYAVSSLDEEDLEEDE